MPRSLLIFSQSDYLIQVVDTNSNTEWQTVQIQISWLLQKPTDLDLQCLQRQGISEFSNTKVKPVLISQKLTLIPRWSSKQYNTNGEKTENKVGSHWRRSPPLRKHAYSNILKISQPKNENFQIKNLIFFYISAQNIDCGYSLEPPRRGGSNEYLQSVFE